MLCLGSEKNVVTITATARITLWGLVAQAPNEINKIKKSNKKLTKKLTTMQSQLSEQQDTVDELEKANKKQSNENKKLMKETQKANNAVGMLGGLLIDLHASVQEINPKTKPIPAAILSIVARAKSRTEELMLSNIPNHEASNREEKISEQQSSPSPLESGGIFTQNNFILNEMKTDKGPMTDLPPLNLNMDNIG